MKLQGAKSGGEQRLCLSSQEILRFLVHSEPARGVTLVCPTVKKVEYSP